MGKTSVSAKRIVSMAISCAVLALGTLPALWVLAQEGTRYYEETGHNVSGEFRQFYDQYGGRAIFGYPLSEVFEENGRQVQYFQRARLELHPGAPDGQYVRVGMLGRELGYVDPPIPESEIPPPNHPEKQYFPQTGHTASFAFLEFYRNNGGENLFGLPISEWIIEPSGRIVQYFERTRMEWYPENPPGQRVQPGMLGTIYVQQFVDPIHTQRTTAIIPRTPVPTMSTIEGPTPAPVIDELRMMATLKRAIIGPNKPQTVYAYVFDQDNHGVPGASVEVEIWYQDGHVDQFSLGATNQNGYSQLEFAIGSPSPGYVAIVKLNARYGGLVAQTSTAFLPWW